MHQTRQATPVEGAQPHRRTALLYTNEVDAREAAGNFCLYLAILQEWDEREKEKVKDRPD
jgi:hypothetical protein